jgi:hypothetical protein
MKCEYCDNEARVILKRETRTGAGTKIEEKHVCVTHSGATRINDMHPEASGMISMGVLTGNYRARRGA